MEAVLAAAVAGFFAVMVAVIQLRVHRDNRRDHGTTDAKLDQLIDDVADVRTDVTDLKVQYLILRDATRPPTAPQGG